MHIIICRTDSIGDVILTLPLAGIIKEKYPDAKITFLGRTYTQPIISYCRHVDNFTNWDKIEKLEADERIALLKKINADWLIHVFPNKKLCRDAKKAGIRNRVGTSHRIYHWTGCNKLVSFSRKKSDLHEAQLNCRLLSPLGISVPDLKEIKTYYGFKRPALNSHRIAQLLDKKRRNIVLHPKSRGSAREWGLDNFEKLIRLLPPDDFKIFISGTQAEGNLMIDFLKRNKDRVNDITGIFKLNEFIAFLSSVDAIVAASTGPLHIAAALGTLAVGIYPPIRPMHPGRWAPLGKKTLVLVKTVNSCSDCRKSLDCHCMREISPDVVAEKLMKSFTG
jgi:heptosyltransferase-3